MLRFANVLGPDVRTSHIDLFSLPAVPMILGFDPRYQFVHEDDVVHALEHAVAAHLPGVFNVAGDGVLALTEVAGLLGKPYAPVLPPWGTGLAVAGAAPARRAIPPEMLNQLRFGRGVDNRRSRPPGFVYRYTSREAVLKLGEHLRLHPLAARRARALPLRARGRGVPALEPARARLARPAERAAESEPRRRRRDARARAALRRPRGRGDDRPARARSSATISSRCCEHERANRGRDGS